MAGADQLLVDIRATRPHGAENSAVPVPAGVGDRDALPFDHGLEGGFRIRPVGLFDLGRIDLRQPDNVRSRDNRVTINNACDDAGERVCPHPTRMGPDEENEETEVHWHPALSSDKTGIAHRGNGLLVASD